MFDKLEIFDKNSHNFKQRLATVRSAVNQKNAMHYVVHFADKPTVEEWIKIKHATKVPDSVTISSAK